MPAEKAAQRRDDDHDHRMDVERSAHHPGLNEVLQQQVGGEDDHEHEGGQGEPAFAVGDDHGQPAAEEGADVGDVAADEVHHDDGEHERQAHQEAGDDLRPPRRSRTLLYGLGRSPRRIRHASPTKLSTSSRIEGAICLTTERRMLVPSLSR